MINRSPAYQWYPKDMLASQRVAEMSAEEECWYRRALDFCWVNGSLPADPDRFARIVGKGCTITGATYVQQMFTVDRKDATRLIHDRQEVERKKQKEFSKKRAKAGRASADKRKQMKVLEGQHMFNTCSPDVGGLSQHNSTLQSSSSSSSSESLDNKLSSEGRARNAPPTRAEIISKYQKNPAYRHLDIAAEMSKADAWCLVNEKQNTPGFFKAWLDKADLPFPAQPAPAKSVQPDFSACPDCKGRGVRPAGAGRSGMVKCPHEKLERGRAAGKVIDASEIVN